MSALLPRDPFAPAWELEVNGTPLGADYKALISSIRVEATVDGADELAITATAWDSYARKFRFLGENILGMGNLVVLRVGTGRNLRALQRFRLVREEAKYPEGGVPTVMIRGYSAEARFVDTEKARTYKGPIADSLIVQQLAAEHGLLTTPFSCPPTEVRASSRTKAQGTTDWDFVRQLATANGFGPPWSKYDEKKHADVLTFRATDLALQDEIVTFRYFGHALHEGGTLVSFEPKLSLGNVPTAVEVTGWDPVQQQPVTVLVEMSAVEQRSTIFKNTALINASPALKSGTQLQVRVLSDSDEPTKDRPEVVTINRPTTIADAAEFGKRWLLTRNQAFMTARAKTWGYEGLWVGQLHRFKGLAPHHEGLWETKAVTHTIDGSGYWCELDLDRVLEEAAPPMEAL